MGLKNVDVTGEVIVQRRCESLKVVVGACEKVDHLAFGVGSGIRAAGASDPRLLTCEPKEGFFQFPLDRRVSGLKLETGVFGSLVLNQKGGPPKLPARSTR